MDGVDRANPWLPIAGKSAVDPPDRPERRAEDRADVSAPVSQVAVVALAPRRIAVVTGGEREAARRCAAICFMTLAWSGFWPVASTWPQSPKTAKEKCLERNPTAPGSGTGARM